MGSGRGILQHGKVGVILTCQGILTQSFNMELRQTESFAFGNIHGGIGIYQIGRGTMCLVTGDAAVTVCPVSPLGTEILNQ